LSAEIDEAFENLPIGDTITIELMVREMTEAEVEAIPDM
jgi:hypothetical protein